MNRVQILPSKALGLVKTVDGLGQPCQTYERLTKMVIAGPIYSVQPMRSIRQVCQPSS